MKGYVIRTRVELLVVISWSFAVLVNIQQEWLDSPSCSMAGHKLQHLQIPGTAVYPSWSQSLLKSLCFPLHVSILGLENSENGANSNASIHIAASIQRVKPQVRLCKKLWCRYKFFQPCCHWELALNQSDLVDSE